MCQTCENRKKTTITMNKCKSNRKILHSLPIIGSNKKEKTVKKEISKELQEIKLKPEQAGTSNIEMEVSPIITTSSTKITNPDGSTRTVAIDHTGMYELNGKTYKILLDARGYTMQYKNEKPAILRTTSTNSYVYRTSNKTAIAYFDANGNIILETYDDKNDIILFEKYMFAGN